jgi:hypothetical protein
MVLILSGAPELVSKDAPSFQLTGSHPRVPWFSAKRQPLVMREAANKNSFLSVGYRVLGAAVGAAGALS